MKSEVKGTATSKRLGDTALDNERKMEGQSLQFISFTPHNFYFIQIEIIFLTGLRDVLLHTSFGIGGGYKFCHQRIRQYFTFLHFCSKVVLGAVRFLQFFNLFAKCLRGLLELSNDFDSAIHCGIKVICSLLERPGEFE